MKNSLKFITIMSIVSLYASELPDETLINVEPINGTELQNYTDIHPTRITIKPRKSILRYVLKTTHALSLVPDESLQTLHTTCTETIFPRCLCALVSTLSCTILSHYWLGSSSDATTHCKDITYITAANSGIDLCFIECINAEIENRKASKK